MNQYDQFKYTIPHTLGHPDPLEILKKINVTAVAMATMTFQMTDSFLLKYFNWKTSSVTPIF